MSTTHTESIPRNDTVLTLNRMAAGLAFAVLPNASVGAVVQLTLVDNQITNDFDGLNADVSGDGVPDLLFTAVANWDVITLTTFTVTRGASALPYGRAVIHANVVSVASASIGILGIQPRVAHYRCAIVQSGGPGCATDGLIPIDFIDVRWGGSVAAWLDLRAVAASHPTWETSVSLQRVIWDDDNLRARPDGVQPSDPAYPEARPIPEPSGLSLLALGAAGVLGRRRRHKQAENKTEQDDR